jgi:glutathione S-transferase
MIRLHYLNNSRAQRILWLLEELQVPYELKAYERETDTSFAPDSLRSVHPLGKSPVITDGAVTLAESGAIIEYLLQTYKADWIPEPGTRAHIQYLYWLHFAEGSLMPPLLMNLVFEKIRSSKMPFVAKPIANAIVNKVVTSFVAPNISRMLQYIDQHLESNTWFAGDLLTGADFQMSFPLEAAHANGLVNDGHRNIKNFLNRVRQREAYERALQKGGDYDYVYQPQRPARAS